MTPACASRFAGARARPPYNIATPREQLEHGPREAERAERKRTERRRLEQMERIERGHVPVRIDRFPEALRDEEQPEAREAPARGARRN